MSSENAKHTSVWTRPPRKERSGLKREQIVAKAFEMLQAEGIEALSMRKLAAELGSGTASLYWHVANRDELIELIIDEFYGLLPLPDLAGGRPWRDQAFDFAQDTRRIALQHTWLAGVIEHFVTAHLGPNVSRLSVRLVGLFEYAGFALPEAEQALNTLLTYVTGSSLTEAAWMNSLRTSGLTEQDWLAEERAVVEKAVVDNPELEPIIDTYKNVDMQQGMQAAFDYGLERVLDGLQVRLDQLKQTGANQNVSQHDGGTKTTKS